MPLTALAVQTPIMPIDLTSLLAVFMGTSIILIPVLGLTARFALKPTVEALSRFLERKDRGEDLELLERRMALLETQIESIESNVSRLVEVSEFHHKLEAGGSDSEADAEADGIGGSR